LQTHDDILHSLSSQYIENCHIASNVTGRHWSLKASGSLQIAITTMHGTYIFNRPVWYRALSLCYACIRSSDIILTP